MNHWVSKDAEDHEACSACGEKVPNAADPGISVIITGDCKAPPLPGGKHLVCARCKDLPAFMGKYDLVELDRHPGFCETCGRFAGDDYYVVRDPLATKNAAGRVTSAPVFGIWCIPPEGDEVHTCVDFLLGDLAGGISAGNCAACAQRKDKYGEARFAPQPNAVVSMPWSFGTEESAQYIIDCAEELLAAPIEGRRVLLMGSGWTYEVRPLTKEEP